MRKAQGQAEADKERHFHHQHPQDENGTPSELGPIEGLGPGQRLQELPGVFLVFQLTSPAGESRHGQGEGDGVHQQEGIDQLHPALRKLLRLHAEQVHHHPGGLYPKAGQAEDSDFPPPPLEKL